MASGFSLAEILQFSGARWVNSEAMGSPSPESIRIVKPAGLGEARSGDIAFFFSRAYQTELLRTQAGILLTGEDFVQPIKASGLPLWKTSAIIAVQNPYLALANLSEKLISGLSDVAHIEPPKGGIHPSAAIDPSAKVHASAQIGPFCTVEKNAEVDAGAVLYPNVYVGPRAKIGERSVLFSGVKIYEDTQIGKRVRIHSNVVLGADGFGYALRTEEGRPIAHQKIYHIGRVVIGDDVEIGAGTCIDRATFGETSVGRGTKIDNQVMIGHNCKIGEGSILCGKVGMAGTASVGNFAYLGGGAGINNQVHVGDGAQLGGMSLVISDVPAGARIMGAPSMDEHDFFKIQVLLRRMLRARKKSRSSENG